MLRCCFHIMTWFVIREAVFHLDARQSRVFEVVSVRMQPTYRIANESNWKTGVQNPKQSWHWGRWNYRSW